MAAAWNALVADLQSFPGSALRLEAAGVWGDEDGSFLTLRVELGEMFESKRLDFCVFAGPRGTHVDVSDASAVPEGVDDIIAEVNQAMASCGGAGGARSVLVRLFN